MGLKRDNEECAHELGGSEDDISGYEDEVNSDEEVELGDGDPHNGVHKEDEMEELEREYSNLRNQEEDLLRNLKRNKEDDALKGQAVKNQKALWDRMLEIRILLQKVPDDNGKSMEEDSNVDGDPELLDDSEFYQQLLKEFLESFNPDSTENIPVLQKTRTKKRKVVDRRPSKSRKIRYHVHEKIVNFMAPEPMDLPPMAPKLFENLFGLKTVNTS